jgi:phytoene synthase
MTLPGTDHDGGRGWRGPLEAVRDALRASDVPVPPLEGKLLRPRLAWTLLPEADWQRVDAAFASGALAIQMAHEASLLHDDIVDGAGVRRGRATSAEERGVGFALIQGDHWLTAAYRAAAAGPPGFLEVFVEAVERTVAGEAAQARRIGERLDEASYRAVIRGKSGELFGAAAALAGAHRGLPVDRARELGRDVGALYQMVDDLLDYCPLADTGKPAFQDYRQQKFTFVLAEAGIEDFRTPVAEVERRLFQDGNRSPMARALARLEEEQRRIAAEGCRLFGHDGLAGLLEGWLEEARTGVEAHLAEGIGSSPVPDSRPGHPMAREPNGASAEALVAEAARQVGGPGDWGAYFGRHSKSFRFAARLFPEGPRTDVEGVYAFCRFTDDLVDEASGSTAAARARLEAWRALVRAAYHGTSTGIPLADVVMGRMARGGAPFHYVDDLLTGVGMDLDPSEYPTLEALETYTYRVAGVVGGCITELFGLHDPALLQRAYAMGHAMQLTNILRDVGEDWRRGRLYLPLDLLAAHDIDVGEIEALSDRGVVPEGWPEAMEALMTVADRHYTAAFEAVPALPPWYRRPVAVAARVYQGIQVEIRRNGYDNGSRRAHTSLLRKLQLGWGGLRDLRRAVAAPGVPEVTVLEALASRDGGGEPMVP